jgi:hypothetical protein
MLFHQVEKLFHVHTNEQTTLVLKMAAFWVVPPRTLVKVDRHFRVTCGLCHQDDGGGRKYF